MDTEDQERNRCLGCGTLGTELDLQQSETYKSS